MNKILEYERISNQKITESFKRVGPHTQVEVTELPKCNFCNAEAEYDGKTRMGPWVNMCELHFKIYGIGLGLGKGQKLILRR